LSVFILTTIYGPTEDAAKTLFLEELVSLRPQPIAPWLVLGDFNFIYEVRDKSNFNLNKQLMGKFRTALNDCELFEFALQNRKFTWSNEREEPTLIRLDRMFCNTEWNLLHTGFKLQAFSSNVFDHCPLVLCQEVRPKIKEVFHSENSWPRVPGYMEVVKEAW
jgi:endonuclease/exonuclease/phosphatase family metal-dependent hydrolase